MRAVVLPAAGAGLEIVDRPVPEPARGEALVRVTACGVCHSDLHVVDGDYPSPLPLVLGHEITGVHDRLGPVMVYAPWGCRAPGCRACSSQQEMICPDSSEAGLIRDGGYAERVLVPDEAYLVPLGDLDPVAAAPLACGGLTAFRAVDRALPALHRPGARVLVLGAGGLGQFAVQFLRLRSDAEVVAGDLDPTKRETAVALGAHVAAAPDELEGPFDAVIDFVGAQVTLETAARLVARQGTVVLVGLFGGRIPFGFGAVPHEATFTTSVWGSLAQLHELLDLARRHPLRYQVEVLPLSRAQEAHDRLRRGDVRGRFVLVPEGSAA